jgi:hypothetical protein
MGRERNRYRDNTKDHGRFMQIPVSIMECTNYTKLGYPAKALLFELARQFTGYNNGRLMLSMKFLKKYGWNSCAVVTRAKKELIDRGFIFETVKGHRPNKASWYAITWRQLDAIDGYDAGVKNGFIRSAYSKDQRVSTKTINPSSGAINSLNAPSNGIRASNLHH